MKTWLLLGKSLNGNFPDSAVSFQWSDEVAFSYWNRSDEIKRLIVYVLYLAVAGSGTAGNLTRKARLAGLPVHLPTVISL